MRARLQPCRIYTLLSSNSICYVNKPFPSRDCKASMYELFGGTVQYSAPVTRHGTGRENDLGGFSSKTMMHLFYFLFLTSTFDQCLLLLYPNSSLGLLNFSTLVLSSILKVLSKLCLRI